MYNENAILSIFYKKNTDDLTISKFIKYLRLILSEFLRILPTCKNVYLKKKKNITFHSHSSIETGKKQLNFGEKKNNNKNKNPKLTVQTNQTIKNKQWDIQW